MVNAKYYITGGIGSDASSEGFGKNFSLPNNAYCEACADCGELFFQHKMNLAYQESRYADLMEETLYNAILGSVDLPGKNFTYTNPLDQAHARYAWHGCPCCVGNIARTLLMLPTWMYAKSADSLFVNLYVGSTVRVGCVGGAEVEIVQHTDYPWKGNVAIVVNPASAKTFTMRLRAPNRSVQRAVSQHTRGQRHRVALRERHADQARDQGRLRGHHARVETRRRHGPQPPSASFSCQGRPAHCRRSCSRRIARTAR